MDLQGMEWDSKRNTYSSIAAGTLFFVGWWLYIDTAANYGAADWNNVYIIITVCSTVAMFMVNTVSNSVVQGTAMDEGLLGVKGARMWLMFAFVLSFACLVASIWVMFSDYVLREGPHSNWPGVALFVHNFFIFLSSLIYKFGRTEELWD
jgi:magnesium-transporting ATPase (P-type)